MHHSWNIPTFPVRQKRSLFPNSPHPSNHVLHHLEIDFAMTDNNNGHTNGNADGHADEPNLNALESPTKPWYLSTKAIARIVNKSVAALESNNVAAFEQSLFGLNNVINVIFHKTSNKDLVINLESTHELIEELDTLRSDQFNIRNDGLDNLRGKLASTIKRLIASVVEQKQMAADFLSSRANGFATTTTSVSSQQNSFDPPPQLSTALSSIPNAMEGTASMDATSLYQRSIAYLQPLLERVKERFPEAFDKLATAAQQLQAVAELQRVQLVSTVNSYQSACCGLLQRADTQVVIKTVQLLQNAQPYAFQAYTTAAPVFNATLERARPYLEPLLARIHEARAVLENHGTVGPYVRQTLQRLHVAMELAKLYCTLGDPNVAVAAGLTGVPPANLPAVSSAAPAPTSPVAKPVTPAAMPPSAMKPGTTGTGTTSTGTTSTTTSPVAKGGGGRGGAGRGSGGSGGSGSGSGAAPPASPTARRAALAAQPLFSPNPQSTPASPRLSRPLSSPQSQAKAPPQSQAQSAPPPMT